MAQVRLLLSGVGLIGRRHLALAMRNSRCELVAIADPAPSVSTPGIPQFADLDSALEATHPDGVIVAAPTMLHVEQALACIRRSIPVLVEKPVADSVENALMIAEAAERTNVPVLVGHQRRHSQILIRARDCIQSGALGRITAVLACALLRKPDRYFAQAPWRGKMGGGPVLINMIHDIDNLRFLCGDIVAVQSLVSNAARGFEVEDTAAVSMRFENGALGTYLLSDIAASPKSWDQNAGEINDFYAYPNEDCYVVVGDCGSLAIPTMRLAVYPDSADWALPMTFRNEHIERNDAHEAQLAHFLDVIAGTTSPLVSVRDAARSLALTLATREAAQSGRTIAC